MRLRLVSLLLLTSAQAGKQVFNINSTFPPKAVQGDAPYDISENLLYLKRVIPHRSQCIADDFKFSVFCVGGVEQILSKPDSKPYLLIPGTGGNYDEDWKLTYEILLGKLPPNNTTLPGSIGNFAGGLGYDVCGVSPPRFMLDDIQDNAQYIAYAIAYLSQKGPIPIQAWSQGNLATSWSLTFFPSIRSGISNFISFAGDFKGVFANMTSISLPVPASPLRLSKRSTIPAAPSGYSAASVIQQVMGSQFLKNAEAKGNTYAWVPTTSLYSQTDDVVQPEGLQANDTVASSFVGGEAGNIFVQQFCPGLVVKHESHQYLNFSWEVVKLALKSPLGFATQAMVSAKKIPCSLLAAPGLGSEAIVATEYALVIATEREHDPRYSVLYEPKIKAYVASFPSNRSHGR